MSKATFILCFFMGALSVFGSGFVNVKKITYSQGLSENTIMDIAQDSLGYIWVGTREGLNRYDGYSCKNYFAIPSETGSLRSSLIEKIFIDSHSSIWVKNAGGIDMYQPDSDLFKKLEIEINGTSISQISDIVEVKGKKWLATPQGLAALSLDSNVVFHLNEDLKPVHFLCKTSEAWIWVFTNGQIHKFDTQRQKYIHSVDLPFNSGVTSLFWFNNLLWITTYNGLWIYDGTKFFPFNTFAETKNATPKKMVDKVTRAFVTSLVELNGKLWISTDGNGIFILDFSDGLNIQNINISSSQRSVSTNALRCLFPDTDKNMWIGTVHNGLNLIPYQQKKFGSLKYIGENPNIPNGNFSSFLEDKNNQLWAASFDGLCLLNQQTLQIEKFVEKGTIINTITIDWDGDIFLGTYKMGLLKYTPSTEKIIKIESAGCNLNGNVGALMTDYKGDVWIGSASGLFRFNKKSNNIESICSGKISNIYSLLEDKDKNIWVGTFSGLYHLNPETSSFVNYSAQREGLYKISNNQINCLYEDIHGNIWVGTNGGGLNRIEANTHEITIFNKNEAFTSNIIHGIAEDKSGNIWFTTNSGLVRLNVETGELNTFDFTDGLLNNQYIDESMFLSASGKMFCGGEKGIDYFYPEDIKKNQFPPRVIINGNFFGNSTKEQRVNDNNFHRNLNASKTLTFSYNQASFGFEIVGIEFANPQKINYAYKLEGFNSDWIFVKQQRTVNYGHVPPGKYIFKAKAANSDGVWSEPTSVKIVVKPPFTSTPLAYVLYFLALALILFLTYRYILERKLLKNKLEFESRERKRIEELNQLKLRLFTHVSHEFRTPLSLIISPVQELMKLFKNSGKGEKELEIIHRNAQKLKVLVNQVLEVRKIESGAVQMQKANIDMVAFLKYSCESFFYWAKQKNINLSFVADSNELVLNVDQGLMEKVIYNLLSNAIKYTEKGFVKVQLVTKNNFCCIEVSDSGSGIAEKHQEKLFEMYYRTESEHHYVEGSGIGLALSKELVELHNGSLWVESRLNKGSKFTVQLPLPKEKQEEFKISEKENKKPRSQGSLIIKEVKVLLVDDNDELRQFLADKLAGYFGVFEAINGRQALEIAGNEQPDIIISDVMMPEMDGWELCQCVKTDVKISHIPIILLTALSETEHTIKGLNLGADAYLAKPFNFEHVLSLTRNILQNRQQIRLKYQKGEIETIDTSQLTELDKKLLENARVKTLENIDQPGFSVQALSDLLGMSRVNLHLKLRVLCDLTPSDFILQLRLKQAVKLLKERKYQISEIADMTGFSSASHFSRIFKKQYGGTPSKFLKGKI